MVTEIQTIEGGWKEVYSLDGTTLKKKMLPININVMVVPVALCGFVKLVSRTGSLGLVTNESDPYLEVRVLWVHVKECY